MPGGARWSLGGPRCSPGAAQGLPDGFRAQNECVRKLKNVVFGPLAPRSVGFRGFVLHYSEESGPMRCKTG